MPLTNRPNLFFVLATGLAFSLAGCGTADTAPPEVPVEELPPYTDDERTIFDDSIAPEVFGLTVDGGGPADPHFATRVKRADLITEAKLVTITTDKLAGQIRYHIVLKPIGNPLSGHNPRENIEITVGRTSPSLSLLRSMATEAVGRKMLVLLRRYRLEGDPVVHFRGEPDRKELIQAVQKILHDKNG